MLKPANYPVDLALIQQVRLTFKSILSVKKKTQNMTVSIEKIPWSQPAREPTYDYV